MNFEYVSYYECILVKIIFIYLKSQAKVNAVLLKRFSVKEAYQQFSFFSVQLLIRILWVFFFCSDFLSVIFNTRKVLLLFVGQRKREFRINRKLLPGHTALQRIVLCWKINVRPFHFPGDFSEPKTKRIQGQNDTTCYILVGLC